MKKFRAKLNEYMEWIRKVRGVMPTGELVRRAKARIQGHLNYYAITDNYESCKKYHYLIARITFKWLNRRSQRKNYNWHKFGQMLRSVNWPMVKIKVDLCPSRT